MNEYEKITFYFDESFHSRKINENTIKSEEYFDNYVSVGIGMADIEKNKETIKVFENKNKKNLSIDDKIELKSSVVKKSQYKYGLSTFNNKSLELYYSFWKMLEEIEIIPYVFVSNKLEYILRQLKFENNNLLYSQEAFVYTLVKAINIYRPHKILSMLLNSDNKIIYEIKKFLKEKIEENYNNKIKVKENIEYNNVLSILNSCKYNDINYNWDYKDIFWGFTNLMEEKKINKKDIIVIIDKEGKDNNTYASCKLCGFKNVYEEDSKVCMGLRCSDLLCGFIGKMMRAIYEDTKFKGGKYDKRIMLSENWFKIDEKRFLLYKLISKVINDKFSNYWSTCISIYFDIFFEFLAVIKYFDYYEDYDKYIKLTTSQHRNKFDIFLLTNLKERYLLL